MSTEQETPFIDFGIGRPAENQLEKLLPFLKESIGDVVDKISLSPAAVLGYTEEAGNEDFRVALGEFLTHNGVEAKPDELCLFPGASMSLQFLASRLRHTTDRRDAVVEDPTYSPSRLIIEDHGFHVHSVPVDENGMVLEKLEQLLEEGVRPAFVYTIPTYQNPTGAVLSEERRQRLFLLSKQYDFKILADEVYHLLRYRGPPLPPTFYGYERNYLAQQNGQENSLRPTVYSIGSFSKILAPGLRVGWVQAAPDLIRGLTESGLFQSGQGLCAFNGLFINQMISEGFMQRHLNYLLESYQFKSNYLYEQLRSHFPVDKEPFEFRLPGGGYFLWIRNYDKDVSVSQLKELLQKRYVSFIEGDFFSSNMSDYLRLCFTRLTKSEIEEGVSKLAQAFKDLKCVAIDNQ